MFKKIKKGNYEISFTDSEISETLIDSILDSLKELSAKEVKDVPYYYPEEDVNITYTEKMAGKSSGLTYGMIETAFKERRFDEGKKFKKFIEIVFENLKDDIANAQHYVSGEKKANRSLLLEDYVKIENLLRKANMPEELETMKKLVDELSYKLDLNYFKPPKFKKSQMQSAANELRAKHRWDAQINKSLKPIFLVSKSELTQSYKGAKTDKKEERVRFESNLEKVRKDMEADYDRINQGRDTYLEDPKIEKLLPEIVDLYETAIKYAEELGYEQTAKEFNLMLNTIKKGWGMM